MIDIDQSTILRAESKHVSDIVDILEKSFIGIPGVTEWVVKRDQKYIQRLRLWFRMILSQSIPYKHVYYSPAESCVAVWYPPDTYNLSILQQVFWIPRLLRVIGMGRFRKKANELVKLADKHPKEPHFYLTLLGTSPQNQGKGIGSFMLRFVLDICKDRKLPAYVESNEYAFSFYSQHGFQTIDEFFLPNSNIKMRAMWQNPE